MMLDMVHFPVSEGQRIVANLPMETVAILIRLKSKKCVN